MDSQLKHSSACKRIAVWSHTGLPPVRILWVLITNPQFLIRQRALLCIDVTATATSILGWFVVRWQLEVTSKEAHTHIGVETERQGADYHLRMSSNNTDVIQIPRPLFQHLTDTIALAAYMDKVELRK